MGGEARHAGGDVGRVTFPPGFLWGATSSAVAIEGATRDDGREESIWDRFAQTPGAIRGGDTPKHACNSYRRFSEDVDLLRQMGMSSYRFSIAWPRVLPKGSGPENAAALDAYSRLVDLLLDADIRPFPTLYAWDLPQLLEQRGGWPLRDTAGRFADYADVVARGIGDRVGDWVLFDEPFVFTTAGYALGTHAPGRRDLDAFLRATHTVNLAQAEAFRAIRATRPDARIGSAHRLSPCEPAGDAEGDAAAAERWHAFANLWFVEPALAGRYPEAFPSGAPLERMGVRDGDLPLLEVPLDFIGASVDARTFVERATDDSFGIGARPTRRASSRDRTDAGWEIWPRALRDAIHDLDQRYESPVIEVTSNGCAYADVPNDTGHVHDPRRIDYHRGYLEALAEAIDAGAAVRSYHVGSLLDGFEWADGYTLRRGLAHVDFPTGARTLKESGHFMTRVAAENGFET